VKDRVNFKRLGLESVLEWWNGTQASPQSVFDFAFARTLSANQPLDMTASAKELKKQALALAPANRVELAETLLASVDDFISPEVENAWRKEVAGRVD
jgi:hypothetical protein